MVATNRKHKLILLLALPDAEALAAMARAECRDMRGQALYLLLRDLRDISPPCEGNPNDTGPTDFRSAIAPAPPRAEEASSERA